MRYLVLGLALCLTGCAAKNHVLVDDYKDKKIEQAKLWVSLCPENIVVRNADDVLDDLGPGVPEEVYFAFLRDRLRDQVLQSSTCSRMDFANPDQIGPLERREVTLPDGTSARLSVPTEGARIESEGDRADLILFLQDVSVERKGWMPVTLSFGGPVTFFASGSALSLSTGGTYGFWDNQKGRLVAYGRFQTKTQFSFAMTAATWEKDVEAVVREILKGAPFEVHRSWWKENVRVGGM